MGAGVGITWAVTGIVNHTMIAALSAHSPTNDVGTVRRPKNAPTTSPKFIMLEVSFSLR